MSWFGRKRKEHAVRVADVSSTRRGLFGRRHLANAPCMLPSDDAEMNRLDIQHYMLRYALRGKYLALVRHPRSIVDVGCGTGRWPREVATVFPEASVIGIDITPPPTEAPTAGEQDLRPENYAIVQADVTTGLSFADSTFDFAHQRLLFLAIRTTQWPAHE